MRKILCLVLFAGLTSSASALELFGKGSISKNYLAADKNTISVSLTGGFGFSLLPFMRVEARYTNISTLQNKMDIVTTNVVGILSDIKTQTAIYSVGLDFQFLNEKSAFQPFIYIGAGYIETERSYYFTESNSSFSDYYSEPKQLGISANAGVGFRLRLAKSLAFEVEAFAYAIDIQKPNPIPNLYGTAGLRIFI